jgi:hypothetical protein
MKGIGNEFERIEEIKTNAQFIIPINFPAYDVSDPNQANQMELTDLRFGIRHLPTLKF